MAKKKAETRGRPRHAVEPNSTAAKIAAARVKAKMSVEQLATRLGVSVRTVYSWESGLVDPVALACELEIALRTRVKKLRGE